MESPRLQPNALAPDRPSGPAAVARPVQWATAFVLGIGIALVGGRVFRAAETRPTDRDRVVIVTAIDLNQAGKTELLQLPGIGESLADAILATRDRVGSFHSVDDLRHVKGIGPARMETLRPYLRVDAGSVPVSLATPTGNPSPSANSSGMKSPSTGKKTPPAAPVDVNNASAEELQQLPGVGPTLARRIMATREMAPFKTVDELRRVSGIGAKTLEKLRPLVTVGTHGDDPPGAAP